MDSTLLSDNQWKGLVSKFKLKDNGLLKALSSYDNIEEKQFAERLKAVSLIMTLAEKLQKTPDAAGRPVVLNYLKQVSDAADKAHAEISKARALADKASKSAAASAGDDKKLEKDEQLIHTQLLAAFQKLKSSKGLSFEFIICDAKPHCGLMVAKSITSQHKEELSRLTGGSKRFLHPGQCSFEEGHFVFRMDQSPSGLAKKLQDSIKNSTGKKFPIVVGAESAEDDEEGQA